MLAKLRCCVLIIHISVKQSDNYDTCTSISCKKHFIYCQSPNHHSSSQFFLGCTRRWWRYCVYFVSSVLLENVLHLLSFWCALKLHLFLFWICSAEKCIFSLTYTRGKGKSKMLKKILSSWFTIPIISINYAKILSSCFTTPIP